MLRFLISLILLSGCYSPCENCVSREEFIRAVEQQDKVIQALFDSEAKAAQKDLEKLNPGAF